jgi:hypothetical protein
MPRSPRSRATALGIIAVVVALSAWLVLGGRPTVHPGVVHQVSTDSAPDRLLNSVAGSIGLADVAVPDATRVPAAGTSSFELWALPACMATLLALLVFRRRHGSEPGRQTHRSWRRTLSLRAPPRPQFA